MIKNISNFSVALFAFSLSKFVAVTAPDTADAPEFFRVFLSLRDPFVATFNETRAPTSRKYEAERRIVMPNWPKTFQTFWSHSFVFALEKQPINLNFQIFSISKRSLVATFYETGVPTSKNNVAEQDIEMPNWLKMFQTFRSRSSVFVEEKQSKNLSFHSFFISKGIAGGYFQENVCTWFQRISMSIPNLLKNLKFFGLASQFLLWNNNNKAMKFHGFFISKIMLGCYFQWNVSTNFPKICISTSHQHSKLFRES